MKIKYIIELTMILITVSVILFAFKVAFGPRNDKYIVTEFSRNGKIIGQWNDANPIKWTPWTMSFNDKNGKRIRISGDYRVEQQ